jgi:hypothetical protein
VGRKGGSLFGVWIADFGLPGNKSFFEDSEFSPAINFQKSIVNSVGINNLRFFLDSFVKPNGHELGVGNAFFVGKAFYHRYIKWIQTEGNWLTGRAWNIKRLCLIEQSLNLLGTLTGNGDVPFFSFFLEAIPYFFRESAHLFILLK